MYVNISAAAFFCLTWLRRLRILGLDGDDTIVVVVLVCLTCDFRFIHPLRDGTGGKLQELPRVRLPVEDCGLREKWREEDGVARHPVPLLLRVCEVAGGGTKEDFSDQETDLFAFRGKGNFNL